MKPKTCKACGSKFEPVKQAQAVCNWECAIKHTANLKAKRERKDKAERKAKLKTRRDWLREAQASFNRFIRIRDYDKPCISCGRYHDGQWQAGHYRTTKAAPELRFNESNVHKQCAPCNNHLSGNIVLYRKGLIAKIGLEAVEELEGPHEVQKWTIDDLKSIKSTYQAKCMELEKA